MTAAAGWVAPVRVVFGGIMAWGGVMHFTVDQTVWKSELLDSLATNQSGFLWREIGVVNIIAGVALLLGKSVPLAAAALLPITLNIFFFHAFRRDLFGLTIGVPVIALNAAILYATRESFRSLF
jgi:putative oxidoreductase